MDLYFDNKKVSTLPISPTTTIKQVKETIKNWLVPQGITVYSIKIVLNNGEEVPPMVFDTATYDHLNFQSKAALLPGGSVRVNRTNVPVKSPSPARSPARSPAPVPTPVRSQAPVPTPAPVASVPTTEAGLKNLKVTDLKTILSNMKQKTSGKKDELITRILSTQQLKNSPASPAPSTQIYPVPRATSPIRSPPRAAVPAPRAASPPRAAPRSTSPIRSPPRAASPPRSPTRARSPPRSKSPPRSPLTKGKTVYVLTLEENAHVSENKDTLMKYWVDNYWPDDIDMEDYGLADDEVDYEDPDMQDAIIDLMTEYDSSFYETTML